MAIPSTYCVFPFTFCLSDDEMSDQPQTLPPRLREIVDDFRTTDRSEKLELLLEYAEQLPPLPERFRTDDTQLEHVHECATPVFIAADREGRALTLHFDIPPESPTVRGFAEILREGTSGETPETVLAIPGDFYYEMGLQSVLSPQRLNGIHFMLAHVKRVAARALEVAET